MASMVVDSGGGEVALAGLLGASIPSNCASIF